MVLVGALSRIGLVEFPNIKPVAALALMAGFYFSRVRVAIIGVVLMMIVSDLWLGGYELQLAFCVYGSMMIACAMGWLIARSTTRDASQWRAVDAGKFGLASLSMSTVFFLLTNFGVWAGGLWYERTLAGLAECFTLAMPFYRATLMGDFLFTGLLVAGYWAGCMIQNRLMESRLVPKKIS